MEIGEGSGGAVRQGRRGAAVESPPCREPRVIQVRISGSLAASGDSDRSSSQSQRSQEKWRRGSQFCVRERRTEQEERKNKEEKGDLWKVIEIYYNI